MAESGGPSLSVELLADHPHLIPEVGVMRWREWGQPPEPATVEESVEITARESGRERLPVTWVAVDGRGRAVGAVGLAEADIEERRDQSPWLVGMIVDAEQRSLGIGRRLVAELEQWARASGYTRVWVGTGGRAVGFYEHCGWVLDEVIERPSGQHVSILKRSL